MNQKPILLAVVLTALLVIGGVFFVWMKKQEKPVVPVPNNSNPIETKQEKKPSLTGTTGWTTYRNEEMGIQFDYPNSWGDINVSKEVGCVDYYAAEVAIPKDLKESCFHITLSASSFDKGAFLSTEGVDYTNTEIPRGADWRFRLISMPKEQENFCLNNPFIPMGNKGGHLENCKKFKTASELLVTKGVREIPFTENEKMTVYFIRTNHPIFYDLVLSSQYLKSSTSENELQQLIETIKF